MGVPSPRANAVARRRRLALLLSVAVAAGAAGGIAAAAPNDPYFAPYQAPLTGQLRMAEAWAMTAGGEGQVLAVVDSGVDPDHPDLAGRVLPGKDFVDHDHDDDTDDRLGHGTAVATVAAAAGGDGIGMAGIAWRAKVLPVRVIDDQGKGRDSDVADGITWATDQGADVINVSVSTGTANGDVGEAVKYALDHDVVVVAAAGNGSINKKQYPAAFDGVIAVTATDEAGQPATFSNYGSWTDLAAPGVRVLTGYPDHALSDDVEGQPAHTYRQQDGTSFAAPIVAGIALLARAQFPDESADQIATRLRAGALDAGPLGRDDRYGYGIVDAWGALGGPRREPGLSPIAAAHEPDGSPDRATLVSLGNPLTATLTTGDEDWFATEITEPGTVPLFAVTPLPGATGYQWTVYDPGFHALGARPAPQTGRWYLRVSPTAGSVPAGPYQVSVATAFALPPALATETEYQGDGDDGAQSVAIGDVTGDGLPDVVFTTEAETETDDDLQESHLVVIPQTGGGRFLSEHALRYPIGHPGSVPNAGVWTRLGVAVTDLDHDGDNDVAVGTGQGVEIFTQAGGLLSGPTVIPIGAAGQVEAGDVDGDGSGDLTVTLDSGGLAVLRNTGSGGPAGVGENSALFAGAFSSTALTSVPVNEVEVTDVDDDGRADVVALECPGACTDVAIYRFGAGGVSRTGIPVGLRGTPSYGCALATGDLTGDRREDFLVGCNTHGSGGDAVRLIQTATGGFAASTEPRLAPYALEMADFDSDGRVEVGWNGQLSPTGETSLHLLWQAPDGVLHDYGRLESGGSGQKGLAFRDLDGDGITDVVTANGELSILRRFRAQETPAPPSLWVRDTSPARGWVAAHPAQPVTVRFTGALTRLPEVIKLADITIGAAVPFDARLGGAADTVELTPRAPLADGHAFLVELTLRSGVGTSEAFSFAVGRRAVPDGPDPGAAGPVDPPADPSAVPAPPGGRIVTPPGYWMLGADGRVFGFGAATVAGDAIGRLTAGATAADLEPVPGGGGYWVLDSAGAVLALGGAPGFGGATGIGGAAGVGGAPGFGGLPGGWLRAGEVATSLSATPSGQGYWIFTTGGRVFPVGDAAWAGDLGAVRLNGPVLDSIATPSGKGYYLVAGDGGIFAFGDARFAGSMGAVRLNAPVQSLVPDPDGTGYWLVAADGGVFAFDAGFRGSMGNHRLNAPVTGMVPFGNGYLMVAADGGIFNFSDREFLGSLGAHPPVHPIVAVAVLLAA